MIQHKLLIAGFLAASAIVPVATSQAQLSIEIGDRGYYNHGPFYYSDGYRMVWVPGHWGPHHRWQHGRYARRERDRHHGEVRIR